MNKGDYVKAFAELYAGGLQDLAAKRRTGQRMFDQLNLWTDRKTHWDQCLRFLRRVDFWKEGNAAHVRLGRRVFGQPESRTWNIPRVVGEVELIDAAIASIRCGFELAKHAHYGLKETGAPPIAHHPGLERALPYLARAVAILREYPHVEVPSDLPRRVRGRKSLLRMPLLDDPEVKVRTRREIVAALSGLLRSMKPDSRPGKSTRLAKALLVPILTRSPGQEFP
jgi:hypothetical protein